MPSTQQLFQLMVERGASDLHFTVGLPPQLRINGELKRTDLPPLTPDTAKDYAYSLLSKDQIAAFEKTKELDASCGIPGLSRFRLNFYMQRGSVGLAVRRIPHEIPTMDELGLPAIIREFADNPNGLLLVTGATGSGKSTTLASMIEHINQTRKCHIITVEDPIEYLHNHKKSTINQRELGTDTLSFQDALKHSFREDPDIVLVGEMRDLETMQAALTLAETGHLILATLHTSDATHAISRVIDVFPAHQQLQIRVQLSMVLIGVVVQQLIPRKDLKGRVLATEIMRVNAAISNLIRQNTLHQIRSMIQLGAKNGMHTINQSLADLVKNGIIAREEAERRTMDPEDLKSLIK